MVNEKQSSIFNNMIANPNQKFLEYKGPAAQIMPMIMQSPQVIMKPKPLPLPMAGL